jgi:hypothetical protein
MHLVLFFIVRLKIIYKGVVLANQHPEAINLGDLFLELILILLCKQQKHEGAHNQYQTE